LLLNGAALWLAWSALLSAMGSGPEEVVSSMLVIMLVGALFMGEAIIVAAVVNG
jgi:hypothetical protein